MEEPFLWTCTNEEKSSVIIGISKIDKGTFTSRLGIAYPRRCAIKFRMHAMHRVRQLVMKKHRAFRAYSSDEGKQSHATNRFDNDDEYRNGDVVSRIISDFCKYEKTTNHCQQWFMSHYEEVSDEAIFLKDILQLYHRQSYGFIYDMAGVEQMLIDIGVRVRFNASGRSFVNYKLKKWGGNNRLKTIPDDFRIKNADNLKYILGAITKYLIVKIGDEIKIYYVSAQNNLQVMKLNDIVNRFMPDLENDGIRQILHNDLLRIFREIYDSTLIKSSNEYNNVSFISSKIDVSLLAKITQHFVHNYPNDLDILKLKFENIIYNDNDAKLYYEEHVFGYLQD